jgi:hypothetical protein
MLPNFIIAGAARSGTTSLYYYLKRHNDIFMSPHNEIRFFDRIENYEKGPGWYEKHFEGYTGEKAIGEKSAAYLHYECVPGKIAELIPDVKLLFILRNPVDRAYSHYWHRINLLNEYRSFEDVVKSDSDIVSMGLYHKQIENYLNYFSKEQILFLLYDDLLDNSVSVLKTIYRFLKVDENFVPSNIGKIKNPAGKSSIFIPQKQLSRLKQKARLPKFVKNIISSLGKTPSKKYPSMKYETRKYLIDFYHKENIKLSKLLDRDLSNWNKLEE